MKIRRWMKYLIALRVIQVFSYKIRPVVAARCGPTIGMTGVKDPLRAKRHPPPCVRRRTEVTDGTSKSAMEVHDHVVKFIYYGD